MAKYQGIAQENLNFHRHFSLKDAEERSRGHMHLDLKGLYTIAGLEAILEGKDEQKLDMVFSSVPKFVGSANECKKAVK